MRCGPPVIKLQANVALPFAETFAAQLRRLRLRSGLSQGALAERAGLTESAIAALE